ncbi:zinc finger protein 714-like [Ctenocephalides felis]|uniref:zinc finger protein 714-like n=1 Tax=Ctenocephalides felis TaxID=7515 RepID=UPI000E6E2DBB|nr:zinc finger protein 714-like [Ctenocephalides felis]
MSDETFMSVNDQTIIKIEPPEYSPADIKCENEDEFDALDAIVKSESFLEDDDTCLERFMNSELTIEDEVKQESFDCDICYQSFAESHHLTKHMVDHMPNQIEERPFECEICQKTFKQSKGLKTHMLIHSGIKLEMEDEFDDPDVIVKSESCSEDDDTCLERFMNSEVTIEEEVKQELVETSNYECDICNRTFAESDNLKQHMADHISNNSKESPFKCEICYKAFNRLSVLKRHKLIHSGERAHECKKVKATPDQFVFELKTKMVTNPH